MHFRVLACDLDGTLAENDRVAEENWITLRQARAAGYALLLVTGRTLESLSTVVPHPDLFEAIVAENGAVVYFPQRDRVEAPFGHLSSILLEHLEALSLPLEHGIAIVATVEPHDVPILELLRKVGGGASIEYNRGAVMVLPPGASKGTGLGYALHELGYSPRNVMACGDAENDYSLFEFVELAAAVANATPDLQNRADIVLEEEDGAGVRALVKEILADNLPVHRPRLERRLSLGHRLDGTPVQIDPFALVDGNLGIFGASGSGKSWLAGLLAEEMFKQGYQACIIDPEGDYRGLRAFSHSLVLGGPAVKLPPVVDVVTLLEYSDINLVLDLSQYGVAERTDYVARFLRSMRSLRRRRGRPHWFLMDEIQSFTPPDGGPLTDLVAEMMQEGGFCIVSYRSSRISPALLELLSYWLITRMKVPREIASLKKFLGSEEIDVGRLSNLSMLPQGQAYLISIDDRWRLAPADGLITFHVGLRSVPHIRHLHKYLRAPLPEAKRFYFTDASGHPLGRASASLWEFSEALADIPIDALRYHLERGDFEHWLQDVIHDDELARRVGKVAHRHLQGDALRRALREVVVARFDELDCLV